VFPTPPLSFSKKRGYFHGGPEGTRIISSLDVWILSRGASLGGGKAGFRGGGFCSRGGGRSGARQPTGKKNGALGIQAIAFPGNFFVFGFAGGTQRRALPHAGRGGCGLNYPRSSFRNVPKRAGGPDNPRWRGRGGGTNLENCGCSHLRPPGKTGLFAGLSGATFVAERVLFLYEVWFFVLGVHGRLTGFKVGDFKNVLWRGYFFAHLTDDASVKKGGGGAPFVFCFPPGGAPGGKGAKSRTPGEVTGCFPGPR